MNVIVDEAGKDETTVKVDDFRVRGDGCIDGRDAIPFEDDGLREAVAGPDPAVDERARGYSSSLICCAR